MVAEARRVCSELLIQKVSFSLKYVKKVLSCEPFFLSCVNTV